MPLETGQVAPEFLLRDQDKRSHSLADYRGKPVVLLFYPTDFSAVCTEEMACMRDNLARFQALDAQVFGISVDSTYSHAVFAEQQGIGFPLLADFHPKGAVTEAYGMYIHARGHGSRGYVVIDSDGKVAAYKDVGPPNLPDFGEIERALAAL
jgi:peroxiredoxin (alkyl hydroperoxide reductase subunit C)